MEARLERMRALIHENSFLRPIKCEIYPRGKKSRRIDTSYVTFYIEATVIHLFVRTY